MSLHKKDFKCIFQTKKIDKVSYIYGGNIKFKLILPLLFIYLMK